MVIKLTTPQEAPQGKLGRDLPDTEQELFKLEQFPIFDENFFTQVIDDPILLVELLDSFISKEPQDDIKALKKAHDQGDWATTEKLAHKIKGGACYLGIHKMKFACQYLERYYKAGHRKLLEELYNQLLEVNAETIEYLKNWLNEKSKN